MRELALKKFWEERGAKFGELGGAQCVESFADAESEYNAIRNSAGLCDFSFMRVVEFPESDGIDYLDTALAANILKLRYGRIIDTFLCDENGKITAEVFVANIDDKVFAFTESLTDSAEILGEGGNAKDATKDYAIFSVDGPKAWEVARDIFGSDIFNLPYLAIEKYDFEGDCAYLMRNGKTGEFGYSFVVPSAKAESMAQKLCQAVENAGGALCGTKAHAVARLESGFFNIYKEGALVGDPIALGLQWMADFSKDSFSGSEAVYKMREEGAKAKITAVEGSGVEKGAALYDGDKKIGEVITSTKSVSLGDNIGLALMDSECAYPSLELSTAPGGEVNARTVTRPMTVSESLIKGMQQ